jgi:hypothetical protein
MRDQAVTKDGQKRYDVVFPKFKKGGYTVRGIKTRCTYGMSVNLINLNFELLVFNATFRNISAISWQPVLVVKEAGVPERTTDPGQATGQLYHCVSSASFFVIHD